MSSKVRAANGRMVSQEEVEKTQELYKKIVETIRANSTDVVIIIDALTNALLFYCFNSSPRILLATLMEGVGVLYGHWKEHIEGIKEN